MIFNFLLSLKEDEAYRKSFLFPNGLENLMLRFEVVFIRDLFNKFFSLFLSDNKLQLLRRLYLLFLLFTAITCKFLDLECWIASFISEIVLKFFKVTSGIGSCFFLRAYDKAWFLIIELITFFCGNTFSCLLSSISIVFLAEEKRVDCCSK